MCKTFSTDMFPWVPFGFCTWKCYLFQFFAPINICILHTWTLCKENLHVTNPFFFFFFTENDDVGSVCFLMLSLHHYSPGITYSLQVAHVWTWQNSVNVGRQWFILYDIILHTWHFWDSVLTDHLITISVHIHWYDSLNYRLYLVVVFLTVNFYFLCSYVTLRWGGRDCIDPPVQMKVCFSHVNYKT